MHAQPCDESATLWHWTYEDRESGGELVRIWTLVVDGSPVAYVWQGLYRWCAYIERTISDAWYRDWASLEHAQHGVECVVRRLQEAA